MTGRESGTAAGTGANAAEWPIPDHEWKRVSSKYAVADLVTNLILVLVVIAVGVVVLVVADEPAPWVLAGIGVLSLVLLVNAVLAFRRVKAIGYVLRDDDLLFRRGILFERVIAVPYGRLQLVDVTRGPLLRALGLATLKFVTASAATGVHLPGLPMADAETLRDRLVELAETRRSGL
ncbi:hypothetical protein GCM10009847_00680 [Leucobacter tardus]|uniref:PH domain-containing protein n=1 Tax=Leucobacter tardus TaxID=501483 RepID=A0A939QN58_9MICO|nr:PH domain-containing protein [Leucobacter tardus]MBO2990981.1 PH domain-containing protein [Leucobacter tardus]